MSEGLHTALARYRRDAQDLLFDHYKEVARRPYPATFTPVPCIRLFVLLFCFVLGSLCAYYLGFAQQCGDALAFKAWGDPECHKFYGADAFVGTTSAEEGQLIVDNKFLPLRAVTAHARTLDKQRFLPFVSECDDQNDTTTYRERVQKMQVNITVSDVGGGVTAIAVNVRVYFEPEFLVAINGLYFPGTPALPSGLNGLVSFPDARDPDVFTGELSAAETAALYANFLEGGRMYQVVARLLESACKQFTAGEHLQLCYSCEQLSPGLALPLIATNAIMAFQLLLALSVFCVHRFFPAEPDKDEAQHRSEVPLSPTFKWKGVRVGVDGDAHLQRYTLMNDA